MTRLKDLMALLVREDNAQCVDVPLLFLDGLPN